MPPKPIPLVRGRALKGRPPAAVPVVPGHASSLLILAPRPPSEATSADPADYRVLMVDRSARGQFGGLTVFPGGKVEPVDRDPRWAQALAGEKHRFPDAVLPHALAAIRETFEEVGLLLIRGRSSSREAVEGEDGAREDQRRWTRKEVMDWRKRIHDKSEEFWTMCEETGSVPMTGALSFWCNWITPEDAPKRFDVKFMMAVLHDSTEDVIRRMRERAVADGTEILGVRWVTPTEAMDQFNAGKINLIDPQFCILGELATRFPRLSLLRPYASHRVRSPFELAPCMPEFAVLDEAGADMIVALVGDPAHTSSGDVKLAGGAPVSLKSRNRALLRLKNAEEAISKGGKYEYAGMSYVRELEWEVDEVKKAREVVEKELAERDGRARM